ncbi:MAG: ABC transporter ATP-binding protein [Candidatus Coatesbacteria bacterium]
MAGIGIEVAGLAKRLKETQALRSITATFDAGKLHGIIGPDGAGKTTLLRLLIGLLRPDAGRITFAESRRRVPFSSVRPYMAYMPQQQSLYPDLSVDEHLEFFRELYRIPPRVYSGRRDRLLHLTRLEPFIARPAGQLSGGMYKKLGLMCALLQSPRVVLLDEPTNGVDPISRREFWELLYGLVGEGVLVILSTSYMDEAERCARVHLLEDGALLASGEPRALLAREQVTSFEALFLRRAAKAVS